MRSDKFLFRVMGSDEAGTYDYRFQAENIYLPVYMYTIWLVAMQRFELILMFSEM